MPASRPVTCLLVSPGSYKCFCCNFFFFFLKDVSLLKLQKLQLCIFWSDFFLGVGAAGPEGGARGGAEARWPGRGDRAVAVGQHGVTPRGSATARVPHPERSVTLRSC